MVRRACGRCEITFYDVRLTRDALLLEVEADFGPGPARYRARIDIDLMLHALTPDEQVAEVTKAIAAAWVTVRAPRTLHRVRKLAREVYDGLGRAPR